MDFKEFKATYQRKAVKEYSVNKIEQPVVSVCVQTYQHAEYIAACLEGILMQKTDFVFEILLGEDNSSDGTRAICLDYAKKFPEKIRLFLHERENNIAINGNPTGRFNFMYNLFTAKGKYVTICEGDDYWTDPLKLQKQVDFLENNPAYVLTGANAKIIDKNGDIVQASKLSLASQRDASQDDLKKGLPKKCTLTLCARNLINDFPIEFFKVVNADTFFVCLLGRYGKYKFMNDIKPGVYRLHDGGIWSLKSKKIKLKTQINTYKIFAQYYKQKSEPEYVEFFKNKANAKLKSLIYLYAKPWIDVVKGRSGKKQIPY